MRSVNVGIGHYNNFIVSELFYVKFSAYSRSKCLNYRSKLIISVYLIFTCFFYVKHLTPKRKYSLILTVTSVFGTAARTVTLYYINFSFCGVFNNTVSKLTGKCRRAKRCFSRCFSCFSCGKSCP